MITPFVVLRLLIVLTIYLVVALAIYVPLTLPWRRRERALVLLDLLELGMRDGESPERIIVRASASRDPGLPVRLHLAAAYLEQGLSLDQALARVPRLVPPELAAMLRLGGRLGDLSKVLPACRTALNDGPNPAKAGLAYVLILLLIPGLSTAGVLSLLNVVVFPKFRLIFADLLGGTPLPAFSQWMFDYVPWLVTALLLLQAGLYFWAFARTGGPRLNSIGGWPWVDRLAFLVPWKRRRMQRNFGAMFALLLDAGVSEEAALREAAECTANEVFGRRAERAVAELRRGVPLMECVRHLDPAGEFRWRLANATHGGRRFVVSLRAWLDALDATASRQELSAAQAFTSGAILANGAVVGAVTIGIFLVFVFIVDGVAP